MLAAQPETTTSTRPVIGGAIAAVLLGLLCDSLGLPAAAAITAAITALCAAWWMTEAIPIPATSLLPIAAFPLLGVLTPAEVAAAVGNPLVLLFLGGFILSKGMEASGAHRRLALAMVHTLGGSMPRLIVAFLITSAVLSMWVSNTATALMLLPVALAVIERSDSQRFASMLMLAIAYGASVGGLGTPIGSPPNLVYLQVLKEHTGQSLGFIDWMRAGLPVVVLMLPAVAWQLTRGVPNKAAPQPPPVGGWQARERRVLLIFAVTIAAWITRTAPFGGWSEWLQLDAANDASIALLGALALFVVRDGERRPLLTWQQAVTIPWGMLLLFAGGICIAKAFIASGLSDVLGQQLALMATLPVVLIVLLTCLMVTFLTELNSNTATAVLLLPILAATAAATGIAPETLMLPAALSASCAFMLPVATPPNAIVFGSDRVPIRTMARTGLLLNFIGAGLITLTVMLLH